MHGWWAASVRGTVSVAGRSTGSLGSMNTILAVAIIAAGSWISMPNSMWSPDPDTMTNIRGSLPSYVAHKASREKRKLPAWSTYTFQYRGEIQGRDRIVYINAFCDEAPADAREQFVRVLDGGTCYFTVKYDAAKRKFFELAFNFEA